MTQTHRRQPTTRELIWNLAKLGAALLAVVMIVGALMIPNPSPPPPQTPYLPACPTEDSDNCYWDAQHRSNGKGRSFVTWQGQTYYLGK